MFAIWEPVLDGDSRGAIDRRLLDDPRVVSFWDPHKISGTWFGIHPIAGLGGGGYVVWDAYYAFRATASWRLIEPSGAVAAGSDIIGSTGGLTRSFIPLLGRP